MLHQWSRTPPACSFSHIYVVRDTRYDGTMSGEARTVDYLRMQLRREDVATVAQLVSRLKVKEPTIRKLLHSKRICATGINARIKVNNDNAVATYFIEEVAPYVERSRAPGGAYAWLRWLLAAPNAFMRALAENPGACDKLRDLLDNYDAIKARAIVREAHLAELERQRGEIEQSIARMRGVGR